MKFFSKVMSWKDIEKYHKEKERRQKMFEKVFKLKANGTTVKTEILAGLTSFMTMAYIISLIFLLKFFVVA